MSFKESSFLSLGPHGLHKVAYVDWAPEVSPLESAAAAAIPPVLCVHGFAGNGRFFDELAAALMAGKRRTVCPDMIGRGLSDWMEKPKDYNLTQYLNDLTALIARMDTQRVDWVGTSMGGVLGMMMAALPKSPVRRLVLNDVGPAVPGLSLKRIKGYVKAHPAFEDLPAAEKYLRSIYRASGKHTKGQWRHLTEIATERLTDGTYRLAYDPSIVKSLHWSLIFGVRMWPIWEKITCPVLVLRGAKSQILTEKTLARMQSGGPPVTVAEFKGVGHAPSLMKPRQIEVVRDFLG